MNIFSSHKSFNLNFFKPFLPHFSGVFISTNEDINTDISLKESKIKDFLQENINFSWDGEIYWFENKFKNQVFSFLNDWFNEANNHTDFEDGIGNLLLVKDTVNGFAIIDTRYDYSSSFSNFIKEIKNKIIDLDYKYYSDSHLIDNLHLGRESNCNEFEILFFFYEEKLIDSSFFLNGIESFNEDEIYENMLPSDKTIAITGKLPVERNEIYDALEEVGLNISNKITKNTWLWTGEKVGKNKTDKALSLGCHISTIEDVIKTIFDNYKKSIS